MGFNSGFKGLIASRVGSEVQQDVTADILVRYQRVYLGLHEVKLIKRARFSVEYFEVFVIPLQYIHEIPAAGIIGCRVYQKPVFLTGLICDLVLTCLKYSCTLRLTLTHLLFVLVVVPSVPHHILSES